MAGPFYNPQAGMGIEAAGASAVVSPVAPVRTSAADAVTAGLNLATQGVSLYGQYQKSQGRSGGTRSGSPDPNVAVFAEEMNKVEQIRSEQGDLAGRLAERAVASNFAAAGVSFKDTAYKSVYESTTGRSFNVYGRDDDEYFRQKALERTEVQAAFVASKAILPPGTSTESALEWSLNEVSKQQAAAYYVNKAQSNATVAWQLGGDEDSGSSKAFKEVRSAFVAGTLGALMQRYESGQVVTPKDIADAKVEWTSLSAGPLRRPPNLSGADGDAQWNAFQEGNERINNFFTTLESASSSKTLLDTQIAILADAVNKSDGMAALEKLVTITGLLQGDSAVYDSLVAGQLGNLYEKLRQVKIPPTATPDTIVTNPPPGSGRRNYEVDPDELAKYQDMTGMDIANQIVATAGHAKVFDPSSIGNAQNQATFGKTMTGMIAALQSSNQGDFFSPAYLKENVLNPKILATLKALEKFDPDQADKLRGGLQLGYQMEKMRQLQNLSSIETGDLAKFTRFNEQTNSYELNVDEFGAGFGKDIVAFNDALGAYNNNLSEAAKDGFNKFYEGRGRVSFGRLSGDVGNPLNIISYAKLAGLTSAVKRRDAIAALDKGISNLNPEPRETELNLGQTMSQAPFPPAVEQPADQGIDISPRPTDQGIDISPRPTDEEDGRSLLQRGLDLIFSPAAAAELTPELRAQLEAVRTRLPQTDIPPLPEAELGSAEAFNLVPPLSQPKSTLAPPMEKVSRVVVKGESPLGYRDWNRGTSNDKPLSKAVAGLPVAYNDILDLTHEEHLARSGPKIEADDPQRLFAIGRYQIIPTTAIDAFKFLGYTKKQKYTPEVQDNMFKYLLMGKRKPLYDYIKDEKGSDKGEAVLEMAKEFASIGVPYDVQVSVTKRDANNKIVRDAKGYPVKIKVTRKKGESYYGQAAPTTPEDIGKQLDALRELYKKDPDALEPMGPKQKQAKAVRTRLPPTRPEDTSAGDMREDIDMTKAIDISPPPNLKTKE